MRQSVSRRIIAAAIGAAALLPAQGQKPGLPVISGFINARYSWDSNDDDTHGFDIRRVRLAASGELSSRIDYKVQAEYETTVKIIDAYLRWKIHPAFNLQLGEFKLPYSQENLYGPTSWLTIENPTAVSRLNGYQDISGIKANGRDVGFIFYGDLLPAADGHPYVSYKAGLFNGNGINTKDDNNRKDFAGLLYVRPVRQLALTAGHYQGSYGARGAEHVRIRTSAGAEWKDSRLTLRSEYLHGNTAGQKSDGAYALAAYKVSRVVQPLVSYDYFKADTNTDEHQSNYQIGVNVTPLKNLRIQAAYTYEDYHLADDIHLVEAQIFVQF